MSEWTGIYKIDSYTNLLDYSKDDKFREELKDWLYDVWQEKDKFLKTDKND